MYRHDPEPTCPDCRKIAKTGDALVFLTDRTIWREAHKGDVFVPAGTEAIARPEPVRRTDGQHLMAHVPALDVMGLLCLLFERGVVGVREATKEN
jgi:hypothetical protein